MAKKLFALEDAELEGMGAEVELETSPEEGEAAAVQAEMQDDVTDIQEVESGVEEGMDAAEQLEEVQDLVEQAAEGEGLDPVAAEALRIAVEAICARVGANPKSVYSLYATENFQSASSRKANTRIALEGVSEFLKNLWEKIKAALKSLWDKVVSFWDKHVSNLGRMVKALESMKDRAAKASGSYKFKPVEAPASLLSIFPTKQAVFDSAVIDTYQKTLADAKKALEGNFRILEGVAEGSELFSKVGALVSKLAQANGEVIAFGSESQPLPGGKYYKWTYKVNEEKDDDVATYTLEIDEDHGEFTEGRQEVQMDVANKDTIKKLISATITEVAKPAMKRRDKAASTAKKVNDAFKKIDAVIKTASPEDQAAAKTAMRIFNLVLAKGPGIEAKYNQAEMAYMKGVLVYSAACLKQYK